MALAELLKRGFDVYQPLVDDQQIDCIVRKEVGKKLVCLDIQIKARSHQAGQKSWGTWPSLKMLKPRPNFFFIFYSEPIEESYWVIPSTDLAREASRTKTGKHEGEYSVTLAKYQKREPHNLYVPRFEKYLNNFDILNQYKG